ncbi:MAG: cyclic pyranopterin monophosphate synthase MoaC [bacterium]
MIDVGEKRITKREAVAKGKVLLSGKTIELIRQGKIPKGDVLNCAKVAAVLAVKKTPELIPMCHPLRITHSKIDFDLGKNVIEIKAGVAAVDRTGVEMEALTAVAVAALTIYDMCKAVDKTTEISHIRLMKKTGGRSGDFVRKEG